MIEEQIDKWSPRALLIGVSILSASPLLIVEMFPGQLKFVMEPSLYLVFHNIAEFFSIVVSLSMFGVGWFTYDQTKNRHALFLSTAFLGIGIMDFMHTLANAAMPPFITPNSSDKSILFWIAARLFQALSLLASAYAFPESSSRFLSRRVLMAVTLLLSFLVFTGVTFFPAYLPDPFIPGVGLTPFKMISEYAIIFFLCAAVAAYWRRMKRTGDTLLVSYLIAFVICIFSEVPFTIYTRVFDTYNVLGHSYKVAAFYIIFQGIFKASVRAPYMKLSEVSERLKEENIQRKRMEGALREAHDKLEIRVRGRTSELAHSNEQLQKEIEDRRKAEEAMRDARDRAAWLARFPEENPNPVLRVAADGVVLYCNPAAIKLAGWGFEVGESLVRPILKAFEKAMASGVEAQEDMEVGDKFYSIWVVPITEECYANVYGRDITERKRAEKTLRASEEKFAKAFATNPAAIAITRIKDGLIMEANETWLALFGYNRDEVIGRSTLSLKIWPTPEVRARYAEAVQAKGSLHGWEQTLLRKTGEAIVLLGSAEKLTMADEEVFLSAWLDITERKRAEEALRKARDELEVRVRERTGELEKSQQRLQQLASQLLLAQEKERKRVAVELHDGLLSELAATKFLLEGKLALLQRGKLSDLGEFKRVGDVLGFAMKEARRIMNNLHPSVLDELGLIAAMSWSCGEYQKSYPHIKAETKIGVTEGDISESIRVVIFRVLQEALNNFARHGKGDRVNLALSKSDGTLEFMIRDNGQGFDVETAQKGLGLESMRERVELSGGEFQIESTLGQGTTIRAIWRQ